MLKLFQHILSSLTVTVPQPITPVNSSILKVVSENFLVQHRSASDVAVESRRLNVDGHPVFRRDHIPGSRQVHEHRAEVRKRRRGADVQPVGQRRRVAERTHPQAVAHGVPHVVRRHGNEKHPRQGAPSVFEAPDPHEEAEREAEDGDERGAVKRRTLRERDGSLEGQRQSPSAEYHSTLHNNMTVRTVCLTADESCSD